MAICSTIRRTFQFTPPVTSVVLSYTEKEDTPVTHNQTSSYAPRLHSLAVQPVASATHSGGADAVLSDEHFSSLPKKTRQECHQVYSRPAGAKQALGAWQRLWALVPLKDDAVFGGGGYALFLGNFSSNRHRAPGRVVPLDSWQFCE
jgi:hypothetical protein